MPDERQQSRGSQYQQSFSWRDKDREQLARIRSLGTKRVAQYLGMRQDTLKAVSHLLEVLFFYSSQGDISKAYEDTIAEAWDEHRGCDVKTVQRTIAKAEKPPLCVLSVHRFRTRSGRNRNHYRILHERIRELVSSSPCPANPPDNLNHPPDNSQGPPDNSGGPPDRLSGSIGSGEREDPPPPPCPPTSSTLAATWQTAEAEVVKYLDRWQGPLNTAKQRVPAEYVVALVQFFESAGSCFRSGALYVRLKDSHPGLPIDKGWPPPADPSRECREAMTILGQCRKVAETMPPMTEEQFRKRYLAQLEKRNLAGFFRESLTRESLTRESLAHVPIPG